ncbi:S8 family peptidase [Kribbella catacumbae]|uniref:S8 family peptidase n=1 Tax=Kribbella catacumbae TaxID=460086 RepID=UPI0003791438|nr:S8 family serine peptidase [Kribbella catacumbae]
MKTIPRVALSALSAAALALTLPAAPAALADSSGSAADTAFVRSSAAAGAQSTPKSAVVTLITGDRVTVQSAVKGPPAYTVTPAPGAERTGITFSISTEGGATYIVPSDVADLVGAESVLDRELFNVTRLVAERLDDSHSASLPLIVQRIDAQRVRGVEGLVQGPALKVLGAHAVDIAKNATDSLGDEITDATAMAVPASAVRAAEARGSVPPHRQLDARAGELAGVSRIWLDRTMTAADWDVNLTQVGAPASWDSGVTGQGVKVAVLDTGIDTQHPDLLGQVVGSANFTPSPTLMDKVGHGTHVAGTIAGTGAKAPGARRGVAFDADLLIGKVLGDDGRGDMSAAIEGMEWAVENGADIVNMSLGSGPTDGTDPASRALNQLSEEHGTLFVVSAGNSGPGANTVSAPSTADAALSVAAVDSAGTVAGFSSRGPRVGDSALKPEIAAPGVAIAAPRSSAMPGTPADPYYATFSGTSMAAPHVAGVAALLAQRHPDWTGERLKAVLMGTAASAKGDIFAVGAGQANAPAALGAELVPSVGKLGYALTEADSLVDRQISFTNTGTSPISANLETASNNPSDPAGVITVSPATLDIAPGETATATVTADASKVSRAAAFTGAVTITPDRGTALRLPVTATRVRWLTVTPIRNDGKPAVGAFVTVLNHEDGSYASGTVGGSGTLRLQVLPGPLAVGATIQEWAPDGSPIASLLTTEVPSDAAAVTLDAATAVPVGAQVRNSTREEMALVRLTRVNEDAKTITSHGILAGGAYGPIVRGQLRISPSTAATPEGTLRLDEHWVLANKGSDNRLGDATTLYDLVYSGDSVPPVPVHQVSRHEERNLARIEHNYYAPGTPHLSQDASTAIGEAYLGLNVATPSFVQTPLKTVRYATADGVIWGRSLFRNMTVPNGSLSMNLRFVFREYLNGQRYEESYWGGPLGGGATGTLRAGSNGATMAVTFDDSVDSDGHIGRYAEFTNPQRGSGGSALYRNDKLVRTGGSTLTATVDPSTANYRLERSYDGKDIFPIGGQISTVWVTEPVAATEAEPLSLPLASLRWSGKDLDLSNRARAQRDTTIQVQATSAALDQHDRRFSSASAWYTTDGGQTWQPAEAQSKRDGTGDYRFTVPGRSLDTGDWVGLRFAAVDKAGNSVQQTLLRAFPVG